MDRVTPFIRLAFGLAALTCSLLMGLDLLGVVPDAASHIAEERILFAESLVTQSTLAVGRDDLAALRPTLAIAIQRNDDVISAGLRASSGRLLVATRRHREHWKPPTDGSSSATHMLSPIYQGGKKWATLELRFIELETANAWTAFWNRPLIKLTLLLGALGFVSYVLYLRHSLKHLDPSQVIPARVQTALDVMAEGVLLLDGNEQIVLANLAACRQLDRKQGTLIGTRASRLPWRDRVTGEKLARPPWMETLDDAATRRDEQLLLDVEDGDPIVVVVNSSPVLDGDGRAKGAIATFSDVTELERSRAALEKALAELEKSQDEIRLQNDELEQLSKLDPLTGAANRRSFMEWFEHSFSEAKAQGSGLHCVMADIDHFKLVNDNHGHTTGDEVIRRMSDVLRSEVRTQDLVCRYGGEEFCVVLSGVTFEIAMKIAERLREKIASPGFASVPITASFGVAGLELGAVTPTELIDQADHALYVSKNNGRNLVTSYKAESK